MLCVTFKVNIVKFAEPDPTLIAICNKKTGRMLKKPKWR